MGSLSNCLLTKDVSLPENCLFNCLPLKNRSDEILDAHYLARTRILNTSRETERCGLTLVLNVEWGVSLITIVSISHFLVP